MNAFGECPLKGKKVEIKSGPLMGETIEVEDWARNVMAMRLEWPSDVRNPGVLVFLTRRLELVKAMEEDSLEYVRVCVTGIYGHVGQSGCIVMPEELEAEVEP